MTIGSLKTYAYILRNFRNPYLLIRHLRHGAFLPQAEPLAEVVLRSGRRIVHPADRAGFLPILLEMWYRNSYRLGDFYTPKAGDVVLDVGAHVGLFCLLLLQWEPGVRITALEPCPENFACLKENTAPLAGSRLSIHHLAIGGDHGLVRMMPISTNRSFDARTTAAEESDAGAVRVIPLSDVFELAGSDHIDLLKMDVEGAEHPAFSTAPPDAFRRIDRIAMEYHDNLVPGTLDLIQRQLAATHDVVVMPDEGELHGRLFAIRKRLA